MDTKTLAQALRQHPRDLGVISAFWSVRPKFHLHVVDCTASTNTAVWDLLNQGAPAGTTVIARSQNAGRGQWGRQWQSPPGGLYLSLALQPEVPATLSSQLTLAGAWGVATSLSNLGVPVQVKWPNDLVVEGRKLGGILTETRVEKDQIATAVIGIGINCTNPVPATGISLQQLLRPEQGEMTLNSLETVAAVVLYGLLQGYLFWQGQGTEALLNAYQSRLANVGQEITLNGHKWQVQGVTPSGNLQITDLQSDPQHDPQVLVKTRELHPGEITLGYNA
ncbi:MAG TPA: biotin--[acetyl-CoA-carboxylase] ligase [Trichocoleus sp.]